MCLCGSNFYKNMSQGLQIFSSLFHMAWQSPICLNVFFFISTSIVKTESRRKIVIQTPPRIRFLIDICLSGRVLYMAIEHSWAVWVFVLDN